MGDDNCRLTGNGRGWAAMSLTRDAEGKHIHGLESPQLEGSCVGDVL